MCQLALPLPSPILAFFLSASNSLLPLSQAPEVWEKCGPRPKEEEITDWNKGLALPAPSCLHQRAAPPKPPCAGGAKGILLDHDGL